jgi:hypothetical protein
MDESEHCCMLRAPRGSLQQLLVPNTDVPTPESGGMDQKVVRHDRPPGKRHQRGSELRMQEPKGKETPDWQVIPPKTVKFVCQMGAATAPVVPVPTVDTPTAMEHAKTDTIYRVLYSPDEAEEVTTTAQVSDAQAAPRVVGTSKKRKPVRPEAMVIPAFGDLESKRKERARRVKKGVKDQRWATVDSTTIWHVIAERCKAGAAEKLLLPLPRPHLAQPSPARGWAPAARPGELPTELVDTGNPAWWDAVAPPSDSERDRWRQLARADESLATEPTDASLAEARSKDRWQQLASLTLDTPIKANMTVAQYWYLWVEYGVEPDQLSEDSR